LQIVVWQWQRRPLPGKVKIVPLSRTLFASKHDAITTITEAYRFRLLRGKRNRRPYATTTTAPETDQNEEADRLETDEPIDKIDEENHETLNEENHKTETTEVEDPVVGRLMSTSSSFRKDEKIISVEKNTRPEDIPDITSLFTKGPGVQPRIETVFDGLVSHDIRSIQRTNQQKVTAETNNQHQDSSSDYENVETEMPENGLNESHTVGPYDSVQDYVNDQPEVAADHEIRNDEEYSTVLPNPEPAYRYSIKVRANGKVLDPPSK
jgi:hypothetical protein